MACIDELHRIVCPQSDATFLDLLARSAVVYIVDQPTNLQGRDEGNFSLSPFPPSDDGLQLLCVL